MACDAALKEDIKENLLLDAHPPIMIPYTPILTTAKTYKIPIAHGEGRFFAADDTIKKLYDNDQILFKYASHEGIISEEFNPNGSIDNIAGITNEGRNVFGMMPHPERAADTVLSNLDGTLMFESLLAHCIN
jgi:phosphoribosylformylglycinamidine synthase